MSERKKMMWTVSVISAAVVLIGGFLLSGGLAVFLDSGA